jgi:hypothetical protein
VNIYEHFFWNYALFHRKPWAWKVGVGGVFPDLVYMVPFLPKILSYRNFMEWMHDPLWDIIWNSTIAKSVHSLVISGALFLMSMIILKRKTFLHFFPFLLGWSLHISFDALTHVSDGYALFFPLSGYRFPAPVSYWETTYYAREYFWISHFFMAALFLCWIGSKVIRFFRRRKEGPLQNRSKPEENGRP